MANVNWSFISTVVVIVGGFLGILAYFNAEYAAAGEFQNHVTQSTAALVDLDTRADKIPILETQLAGLGTQIQQFQMDSKKDRLREQIENTEDKIDEMKRLMDRNPQEVTDEDRRTLDKLKRRLRRYESQLESLEANS